LEWRESREEFSIVVVVVVTTSENIMEIDGRISSRRDTGETMGGLGNASSCCCSLGAQGWII
jgi:hypothetical protein